MTDTRFERLKHLFNAAIALAEPERARFLDQQCAHDAALRAELEQLLQADTADHGKLAELVASVAEDAVLSAEQAMVGRRIGAFRTSGKLADGGMGSVYLAQRVDGAYEQQVAIKFLTSGLISSSGVRRFVAERQILANLKHPYIANLIDGGSTEEGVPYLVMEYIEGRPLLEYCTMQQLDLDARLLLFRKVCKAIQYAHQHLVIHRDIKSSNILVTADGNPKLLDFGIAKLLDADDNGPAQPLTRAEARVFTPQTASPEQIKGDTVTTATDVYGLGALLYSLLTDEQPYGGDARSAQEIYQAIVQTDPDRPSTVVVRRASTVAQQPDGSARQEHTRRARALRGDLDNIVLTAMRKEPDRRYASVGALLDDIDRYRQRLPVAARRSSISYRLGKFLQRHRLGASSAALVVALVVTLVTFYTVELARERDRAQLEAEKATSAMAFLTELFREADPKRTRGQPPTAQVLLARGAKRIDRELSHQPQARASLHQVIARSYYNMGEFEAALGEQRRATQLRRDLLGADHPEVSDAMLELGIMLLETGNHGEAASVMEDAFQRSMRAHGRTSYEVAKQRRHMAELARVQGDMERALRHTSSSIEVLRNYRLSRPAELASALLKHGSILRALGRFDEVEPVLLDALQLTRTAHGELHPEVASALNVLGNMYMEQGRLQTAMDYLKQCLAMRDTLYGSDNIRTARTRANIATVQYKLGQYAASLGNIEATLPVFRNSLGDDHPHVAFLTENLANSQLALGNHDTALQSYLSSAHQVREIFGEIHDETGRSLSNVGGAYLQLERYPEAEEYLRRADRVLRASTSDEHFLVLHNGVKLAEALTGNRKYEEAELLFKGIIAATRKLYPTAHTDIAQPLQKLGSLYLQTNRLTEAESVLRESLDTWSALSGTDGLAAHQVRGMLGRVLALQGRHSEAKSLLAQSHEFVRSQLGSEHATTQKLQTWLNEAR